MTESDRIWIREQATKIRAAHHVKPIRTANHVPHTGWLGSTCWGVPMCSGATPQKCPFCQQVNDHADHCPLARMKP
jgi:hypothetical protein